MDLGFKRAGFRTLGLCEWDEWRRRLLAARFPGVPIHHNLTELADWAERDPDAVRAWLGGQPDVLIGGTPCQDLSVAGLQAGLDGARSGLYFDFQRLRIALGIKWAVWENVAGALSSQRGLDFASVLGAFVGADVPVPAGGWSGAGVAAGPWGGCVYRLLDAQHFGVPQRRRRIFVVGHLGGPCPPEILLEQSGGQGHPQARREARQGVAAPLARGSASSGVSEPGRRQEDDINLVAGIDYTGALQAKSPESGGWRIGADEAAAGQLVAPSLVKRYAKGTDSDATDALVVGPLVSGSSRGKPTPLSPGQNGADDHIVTHTLRAEGFDASEDGTGRGTPLTVVGDDFRGGVQQSVGTNGARSAERTPDQEAPQGDAERVDRAATDPDGVRAADGLAPRLDVVGVSENQRAEVLETPVLHQLTAGGGKPGQGYPTVRIAGEQAATLTSAYDPQPDGRRYAACGDGVVAGVAEWIARRLATEGSDRAAA